MAVGVANSSDRISLVSVSILEALSRAAERLWAWLHFLTPFHFVKQSVLRLVHQAGDDGRKVLQGQQLARNGSDGLNRAFMRLQDEFASGRGVRLRIFFQGKRRALASVVEDQIHRIGREGIVNALRHSERA